MRPGAAVDPLAIENHLSGHRLVQPQQGLAKGRFARPGFADNSQRFMALEGKTKIVDGNKFLQFRLEQATVAHHERHPHAIRRQQHTGIFRQWFGGAMRLGSKQLSGIGVVRRCKQPLSGVVLTHLAMLHDVDVIGKLLHDRQVMGDEHHGHAALLLQIAYEVEDLRLYCHIQCCGGFVGDQHIRIVGERHGDHDTLPLTA